MRFMRIQIYIWVQGDRLVDDGDVDVFDDECKEIFIIKSDVFLVMVVIFGVCR